MSEYDCISVNFGPSDSVWGLFQAFRACLGSMLWKIVVIWPSRACFRAFLRTRPLRDMFQTVSQSMWSVSRNLVLLRRYISRYRHMPTKSTWYGVLTASELTQSITLSWCRQRRHQGMSITGYSCIKKTYFLSCRNITVSQSILDPRTRFEACFRLSALVWAQFAEK